MPAYLITYDLSYADGQRYEKLIEKLEEVGAVKLTESAWHFSTSWDATRLAKWIRKFMHNKDVLTVDELTRSTNHTSYGLSAEALEWRKRNIRPIQTGKPK